MSRSDWVWVRPSWRSPEPSAAYRLGDLADLVRTDRPAGDGHANHAYVFATVRCDRMAAGKVLHDGGCPRQLQVCVVGVDNDPDVMDAVRHRAKARR